MITQITAGAKLRAASGVEEAVVLRLRGGARGGGGRQQQEVRGLPAEVFKLRAVSGGQEAVVRWLREGARGDRGPQQQEEEEVRGLPAEEAKFRAASGPGCAKAHAGAVSVTNKCEGCGLKSSSFGLPGDEKKLRWCAGCAKAHAGAVDRRGCGPKEKKQKATDPPLTVSEH